MSIFKKKEKTNVIELYQDKEVVYRVTIDPTFVQFEAASKDWLARYSAGTFTAGIANFLVKNEALEELAELVRVQYFATWMFHDVAMIKEFYRILERSQKRLAKEQKKEDDAQVLAEQKVIHEQSVESVEEYEKKRNSKKK